MAERVQRVANRIVLVDLEPASFAIKHRVGALAYNMLLQLLERLGCSIGAVHGTAEHFRVTALLDMVQAILQLENL